jgi:hypothetical protein
MSLAKCYDSIEQLPVAQVHTGVVIAAQFTVLMVTCVVDMVLGMHQHCYVTVMMVMLDMIVNLFVIMK